MKATTSDHHANQQNHRRRGEGAPGIGADLVEQIDHAARQADHDAGKDQQRHAVAHAAFGDLLAQPHDESAARGQGQHGHQNESRAGMDDEISAPLQLPGNTERLHRAQNHSQIARPLGDLLAPQFAFLLQLGQRLIDHGQQLQNDGRRDVGHDAQGENRQAAQLSAGKQIDETQQAAFVLLEELLQLVRIHTRRGNVSAQAIHRQQPKRKQNALAQVRNAKDVGQFLQHRLQHLELAAGLGDLFLGRLGKLVGMHGERDWSTRRRPAPSPDACS